MEDLFNDSSGGSFQLDIHVTGSSTRKTAEDAPRDVATAFHFPCEIVSNRSAPLLEPIEPIWARGTCGPSLAWLNLAAT
jgi:hypothetical protein